MNKLFISFAVWILSIYFVLFGLSFYAHVNESNIVANRANALLINLTREDNSGLMKVAIVQSMKIKTKPSFWQPRTLFDSLFGERQTDKAIKKMLSRKIEYLKNDLKSRFLGPVDLRESNLSNAFLLGADLSSANLQRAHFENANLIFTNLAFSNLFGASLYNSNVYKTNFANAILKGANLNQAQNVTCEQIRSAVIDESTRLPDYIRLTEVSSSNYNCLNLMEGKVVGVKGMDFTKTNLYQADLRETDLSDANLMGISLVLANLDRANLKGANLKGADLKRSYDVTCEQIQSAVIDENTRLPDYIWLKKVSTSNNKCINLNKGRGVDLKGVNLAKALLNGTDLRDADFSHADLSDANLSNANLNHTNFRDANLMGGIFAHANLGNADLEGANLKGADLKRSYDVTCEQIQSAVIDENTRLPDYIWLKKVSTSNNKCINLNKGRGVDLKGVNLAKALLNGTDLRDADFSHADLSDANLSNANLNHTNFRDANLMGGIFAHANLGNADLEGANLKGADLKRSYDVTCEQIQSAVIDKDTQVPEYLLLMEFTEASFRCINLKKGKGVDLKGVNLAKALLNGTDLRDADFSHADLSDANLSHANLSNANFSHANLMETDLSFALLGNVDLKGANLKGANFKRAYNVTCEQILSAVIDESTRLPDYILLKEASTSNNKCINLNNGKGIDLKGVNLAKAFLNGADLLEANFINADLNHANLSYANLSNANFSHANLMETDLSFALLRNVDLKGANLKGANFKRAYNVTCEQILSAVIDESTRLPDYILLKEASTSNNKCINLNNGKGIDLKGVNLAKAFLNGADLRDADFSGADLSYANLSRANLRHANFRHANLMETDLSFAQLGNVDLKGTNLKGANLERSYDVTCEQIQSAVIDKDTQVPDYIRLAESTHECESKLK